MPMVLRSRRSIHPDQADGVELQATPRRASRLQGRVELEEAEDAESSEPVLKRVMERDETELQEEEEAAEEADLTELKPCSVLLDRLHADDRDEMSRKGLKPVSRIPTFQKRPSGAAPTPEPPLPKRETLPPAGGLEGSKSRPPEVREPVPPPPAVRVPKAGGESPSEVSGEDRAAPASMIPPPRGWSLPEASQCPGLSASPRPALRSDRNTSKTSEAEADTIPDVPDSFLPCEGSVSEKPPEQSPTTLAAAAAGDNETPAERETGREETGREETGREETGREETGREETGRVETGRVETGRVETGREETGRVESVHGGRVETGRVETGRVETGRVETGRVESVHGGRVETGREETGREETGRVETGRVETGRVETGREETGRVESVHGGREETGRVETGRVETGRAETGRVESVHGGRVDAIMDEEPPWKMEAVKMQELKESVSTSEAESEEGSDGEKPEKKSWEPAEEPLSDQSESPDLSEEQMNVDESTSDVKGGSATSARRSGCPSFFLCCLLPAVLLLLGGLAQHVWLYGLPQSVSQLSAQLELHWMEGFGFGAEPCSADCRVRLVESIPDGLYPSSPPPGPSIADSWLRLLEGANSSVHIAAFYFSLQGEDPESPPPDSQGRKVFEQLKQLESRGVELQIAVNAPQTAPQDTADLAATGADVRQVNLSAVTGGVVHTKMWVVDQKHVYLGSANMDWRSLTQVKEVGVSLEDCSCLAQDAFRIFGVYWSLGGVNASLPPLWPARLSALSSAERPLKLKLNGVPAEVYLASAPPQISARGRSDDLAAILSVIDDAQKLVYISVMDYLPLSQFTQPLRFWPAIDSRLRAAGCTRGVDVRLMVSCWDHSPPAMFVFLQSLLVLSRPPLDCSISVKVFTVPSTPQQQKIPFARVNHAKYMVTERAVYIGTSNWSENYFTQTAGVGLVVNQTGGGQATLQSQTQELFLRDWNSEYASTLSAAAVDACPR